LRYLRYSPAASPELRARTISLRNMVAPLKNAEQHQNDNDADRDPE
jgi:hypothetical protein